MIQKSAHSVLETEFGDFEILIYTDDRGQEHVVLHKAWEGDCPTVRIHSKCATGDIFGSTHCDCRSQLHQAMKLIQQQGGLLIYLEQEGRGLGLTHKIQAYELQRQGLDTVEADEVLGKGIDRRSYRLAADILKHLNIHQLTLLTNNPQKLEELEREGLRVQRTSHLVPLDSVKAKGYLQIKQKKLGHLDESV